MLNTAILDLDRFEVRKNPIFHNSSFRPQIVRYAEGRLTCKFELNTAILEFDRFQLSKNPIFHNSSRKPQMARLMLVTLKAA